MHHSKHILFIGWVFFVISMFSPWFGMNTNAQGLPGWIMVYLSLANLDVLFQLRDGDLPTHLIGLSALVHVFMILSPWFYSQIRTGKCQACWAIGALSTAIMATILIIGLVTTGDNFFGNMYGYYIWCLSIPLVAQGLYLQTRFIEHNLKA